VQLIAVRLNCGPYDEFLSLYGAERVLRGGLPYRDFWTMYGPAQFYIIAAFFKLFGVNALAGRVYDALIRAGIACACFVLVAMLAPRRWALVAFGAVLVWLTCIHVPAYNFPAYAALLGSLISAIFFARFLRNNDDTRMLFLSGLAVSVTATIRHDSGFYLCLAQLLMLAWVTVLKPSAIGVRIQALRDFGRLAVRYFAGVVLIAGPLYLWLLLRVGFHPLFYDLIYVPAVIYPKVRRLPFLSAEALSLLRHPLSWQGRLGLEAIVVVFPILAILSVFLCLLVTRRSNSRIFNATWRRQTFAMLLLLGILFFVKGLIRVSPIQMMQSIVVAVILITVLFGHRNRLGRLPRLSLYACAFFLALCSYPLAFHLLPYARHNLASLLHPQAQGSLFHDCHRPADLDRARCLELEPEVTAAVEDIERRTSPQDKIYVGSGHHDRLMLNDVRLYFLSGRSSITPWYDLHPGVQTTLSIQNEIIDAMRRNPPKVIVLNTAWDNPVEPNQGSVSSGVTALDNYIHSHYTQQKTYGSIAILTPRAPQQAALITVRR